MTENSQQNQTPVGRLTMGYVPLGLMILSAVLLAAPRTVAKSIEDYCLSRVGPIEPEN